MREAALLLAGFAASWLGFALLASSQAQHRKAIAVTRLPSAQQRLIQRGAGGLLLLFALVPTYLRDGPSFGVVLWLLLLSLAAMTLALMLAWRPGCLSPIARMSGAIKPRMRASTAHCPPCDTGAKAASDSHVDSPSQG